MCEEDQITLFSSEDNLRSETWAIKKIRPVPLLCEKGQIHVMCEDDQVTLLNSGDNLRLETWAIREIRPVPHTREEYHITFFNSEGNLRSGLLHA